MKHSVAQYVCDNSTRLSILLGDEVDALSVDESTEHHDVYGVGGEASGGVGGEPVGVDGVRNSGYVGGMDASSKNQVFSTACMATRA